MTCRPCSPSRRSRLEERREQIARYARHFTAIIRRTREKRQEVDPELQVVIDRTRQHLSQIHQVGQRYLPEAPSQPTITDLIEERRNEDVPARRPARDDRG
jgi:hypothetical protein